MPNVKPLITWGRPDHRRHPDYEVLSAALRLLQQDKQPTWRRALLEVLGDCVEEPARTVWAITVVDQKGKQHAWKATTDGCEPIHLLDERTHKTWTVEHVHDDQCTH